MKRIVILLVTLLLMSGCSKGGDVVPTDTDPATDTEPGQNTETDTDPNTETDTDTQGDPSYQISKEFYEQQLNRDYVLFNANYMLWFFVNGNNTGAMELDSGKAFNTLNRRFYKYEDFGSTIRITSYDNEGYPSSKEVAKTFFYPNYFDEFNPLFDVPFDSLSFDAIFNKYVAYNVQLSDSLTASSVSLQVHNNILNYFEVTINDTTYRLEFTQQGTTHIDLPTYDPIDPHGDDSDTNSQSSSSEEYDSDSSSESHGHNSSSSESHGYNSSSSESHGHNSSSSESHGHNSSSSEKHNSSSSY